MAAIYDGPDVPPVWDDRYDNPEPGELGVCQWFALCENDATQLVSHPVLGDVPACARCMSVVGITPERASCPPR